jgi:hypothetical protein
MHRNHPQNSAPNDPHQNAPTGTPQHITPAANAKNRSAQGSFSLSTQQSPLNTLPRQRDVHSPRVAPQEPTIRSDLLPQRAQRRTRT